MENENKVVSYINQELILLLQAYAKLVNQDSAYSFLEHQFLLYNDEENINNLENFKKIFSEFENFIMKKISKDSAPDFYEKMDLLSEKTRALSLENYDENNFLEFMALFQEFKIQAMPLLRPEMELKKSDEKINHISALPPDVLNLIVSFLPVNSLVSLGKTSKFFLDFFKKYDYSLALKNNFPGIYEEIKDKKLDPEQKKEVFVQACEFSFLDGESKFFTEKNKKLWFAVCRDDVFTFALYFQPEKFVFSRNITVDKFMKEYGYCEPMIYLAKFAIFHKAHNILNFIYETAFQNSSNILLKIIFNQPIEQNDLKKSEDLSADEKAMLNLIALIFEYPKNPIFLLDESQMDLDVNEMKLFVLMVFYLDKKTFPLISEFFSQFNIVFDDVLLAKSDMPIKNIKEKIEFLKNIKNIFTFHIVHLVPFELFDKAAEFSGDIKSLYVSKLADNSYTSKIIFKYRKEISLNNEFMIDEIVKNPYPSKEFVEKITPELTEEEKTSLQSKALISCRHSYFFDEFISQNREEELDEFLLDHSNFSDFIESTIIFIESKKTDKDKKEESVNYLVKLFNYMLEKNIGRNYWQSIFPEYYNLTNCILNRSIVDKLEVKQIKEIFAYLFDPEKKYFSLIDFPDDELSEGQLKVVNLVKFYQLKEESSEEQKNLLNYFIMSKIKDELCSKTDAKIELIKMFSSIGNESEQTIDMVKYCLEQYLNLDELSLNDHAEQLFEILKETEWSEAANLQRSASFKSNNP